ncbi:helix-turn-helix domain containing protein [Nocardiopsis sp. N85]|uniref:TetR/AcrR family transcriptional regulator n=1 Tax=Nocardiopsis sp. N85 TaxID=3029400 RepID=UPI00237F6CB7|nr:TetR/AcrR family transcriptional regulator [Nocardiopsis sp. N85]MDE3725296.1 helix-turn-helix domain containing protein [Nocardiopsis sp. N85]
MSRNYAGLSRERIILEALHIIAGRGLGGLSMRRLGDALEVEAMAIYHHFPLGKEQLFNAIAAYVTSPGSTGDSPVEGVEDTEEEIPEETTEEETDTRPWDERLVSWADDYRARLLEYSGALSLLVHRAPATPADTAARALAHRAFTEAGVPTDDLDRATDALYSYCLGAVVHQVRHQDDEDAPGAAETAARFHYGLRALLRGLT